MKSPVVFRHESAAFCSRFLEVTPFRSPCRGGGVLIFIKNRSPDGLNF